MERFQYCFCKHPVEDIVSAVDVQDVADYHVNERNVDGLVPARSCELAFRQPHKYLGHCDECGVLLPVCRENVASAVAVCLNAHDV